MNEHTTKSSPGGSGRTALWIVLALALAALSYLTLGLAIPNNPLYSDRDANGISKYRFLEYCQDKIAEAPQLSEIRSAMVDQGVIGEDDSIRTHMLLESPELVDSIRVSNEPSQSWVMAAPVLVRSELTGAPLLQAYAQCHYDRQSKETVVNLQPAQ